MTALPASTPEALTAPADPTTFWTNSAAHCREMAANEELTTRCRQHYTAAANGYGFAADEYRYYERTGSDRSRRETLKLAREAGDAHSRAIDLLAEEPTSECQTGHEVTLTTHCYRCGYGYGPRN